MFGEKELAFLKTHLGELSPAVLRQLKRDVIAEEKTREAEAVGKAKGSSEIPTGQSGGLHLGLPQGPQSQRRQAQSQRVGLVLLGQFAGTCN
jgi:hypothetical protein